MSSENNSLIIYNTPDGKSKIALMSADGTVWLSQSQMAELFATSVSNINIHIGNILSEKELDKNSVIKEYLTTGKDGKKYMVSYYALPMILAVGFRIRGVRGVQFRKWANTTLKEYLVKGFVIDDERLKNPDGRPDYFDELLDRIRDIRASEKRFYQKVRDLFALSSDYDSSDKATQMFFTEAQNKLLYAVTRQTAAEIVLDRADPNAPNMGLTSWKGNIVRKGDIIIAKNYLTKDEIDSLNRLVVIFLESAEMRVKDRQDLTISFWRKNIDSLLAFSDKPILQGHGKIKNEDMERIVKERYGIFDLKRKQYEAKLADQRDIEELKQLESDIEKRNNKKDNSDSE